MSKDRILTAKKNAGFPAKKNLFEPVAGKSNKEVWQEVKKGNRAYCIVKGQKYKVSPDFIGNGEIFDLDEIDLARIKKAKDEVSSDKKTDPQQTKV